MTNVRVKTGDFPPTLVRHPFPFLGRQSRITIEKPGVEGWTFLPYYEGRGSDTLTGRPEVVGQKESRGGRLCPSPDRRPLNRD